MDNGTSDKSMDTSDADTLATPNDYEKSREHLRNANSQGFTRPLSEVDVQKAEEDFAELSKQLSTISHDAKRTSRQISRGQHDEKGAADVESSSVEDEQWDLETTLRGNRAAEVEAGIKPKRIGEYDMPLCHWTMLILTGL